MTEDEIPIERTPISVNLPIGDVPENATITKIRGSKPYVVRDKLTVYTYLEKGPPQTIAAAGTRFLVADDGSVVAAAYNQQFEWHTTYEDLHHWLSEQLEPVGQ